MSTPNPEDPPRRHTIDDFDAEPSQSRIAGIIWILALVALVAIGIWWYGRETTAMLPGPPTSVEAPIPAVDRPDAPGATEGEQASIVKQDAAPAARHVLPKVSPKPVAAAPRDRDPVPLPTNRQPDYPSRALRSGIEGSVSVLIEINARGVPTDVRVVSRRGQRSRDLDRAVLSAARDWRFEPARREGRPVPGQVILPVDFQRN